jgi:hypothetical protein
MQRLGVDEWQSVPKLGVKVGEPKDRCARDLLG